MPLLLEGFKILPDTHLVFGGSPPGPGSLTSITETFLWNFFATFAGLLPLLMLAGLILLIGGISFYVSTLGRNALQTIAPAAAGVVLTWVLILVATVPQPFEYALGFLWRGPLPYFIVFPAMALALLALTYGNYQHVLTGWKLGRRNLLTLTCVFVLTVTATSAIYHRAWEKLTPFEPPHGAARLSLSNPASLSTDGEGCQCGSLTEKYGWLLMRLTRRQ